MQCFHNQLNKALPIDSQHDLGVLRLAGQLIVVADRFATRQLTGRFNIDVHFFGLEHLWFNQPGNRARIVQRCSLKALLWIFMITLKKAQQTIKCLANWIFNLPQRLNFRFQNLRLVRNV